MQHKDSKICFIAVLLHLLLLRSFGFAADVSPVLYALVYIASYYIAIFILSRAAKTSGGHERITLDDLRVLSLCFISMVGVSSAVSLIFDSRAAVVVLTPYTFILSAILAPILEELLWRHGVYRVLSRYGFIPAALISSLLFALMHSGTAGLCYAFFSGVVFCLLYERTKSPMLPIILHIFNNSLSLISSAVPSVLPIALLAMCAVCFVLGFVVKERKRLDILNIKYDVFKDYYFYLTVLAFVVLRFTEA